MTQIETPMIAVVAVIVGTTRNLKPKAAGLKRTGDLLREVISIGI